MRKKKKRFIGQRVFPFKGMRRDKKGQLDLDEAQNNLGGMGDFPVVFGYTNPGGRPPYYVGSGSWDVARVLTPKEAARIKNEAQFQALLQYLASFERHQCMFVEPFIK